MKKILKDDRGSISTVVLVTVLFFVTVLSTGYMIAATLRQGQLKSELVAKETYEKPLNNLEELADEIKGTLQSTAETTPYLPDDSFKKVPGTDLSKGLVIEDKDENQYVWVEVPKNLTVYPTAGLNITNFTDDEYTKIENDLHTYTNVYRNNTTYSDTWAEDTANEGWLTESEYYTLKKKMLKSVYQNGGFYVGRYEAGIAKNRTSNTDKNSEGKYITPSTTPVTKADAYPYTWVTRTQAQNLASKVNAGTKTSSLMFGVQWDLVIAFMSKDTTKITDTSILTSNSTTIGNYRDSVFQLSQTGKYATMSSWNLSSTWSPSTTATASFVDSSRNKIAQSSRENGILVTTGTSEKNKVMNIYDIAGNVGELTLEKTSYTSSQCAIRGGGYSFAGSELPAANRINGNTEGSGRQRRFPCFTFLGKAER